MYMHTATTIEHEPGESQLSEAEKVTAIPPFHHSILSIIQTPITDGHGLSPRFPYSTGSRGSHFGGVFLGHGKQNDLEGERVATIWLNVARAEGRAREVCMNRIGISMVEIEV